MEDGGFLEWLNRLFGINPSNETNPGTEVSTTIVNETEKASKKIKDIPKNTVKATEKYADATSEASTDVAVRGVIGAPVTGGTSLEVSADALIMGTVADGISAGAKTVDAIAFDGSKEAALKGGQFLFDIVGGKIVDLVAGEVRNKNVV